MSASLAALIVFIYPAIVAVLSLRVGHRLVGRRPWVALAMALAGTALALGGIPAGAVPPLIGLVQVILSPIIYAVWIVLSARLSGETTERVGRRGRRRRRHGRRDGADDGRDRDRVLGAGGRDRAAGPACRGARARPGRASSASALVSTFVAIQTFYAGTKRIGAAQASLISTFEPIWTIALASLLFDERLGPLQVAGGALVIGGVILAQTSPATLRRGVTLRVADE